MYNLICRKQQETLIMLLSKKDCVQKVDKSVQKTTLASVEMSADTRCVAACTQNV